MHKICFSTMAYQLRFTDILEESLTQELASSWITLTTLMDAEMFLIPVIEHAHYYCICINMKKRTLQILDNLALNNIPAENKYNSEIQETLITISCFQSNVFVVVFYLPLNWDL